MSERPLGQVTGGQEQRQARAKQEPVRQEWVSPARPPRLWECLRLSKTVGAIVECGAGKWHNHVCMSACLNASSGKSGDWEVGGHLQISRMKVSNEVWGSRSGEGRDAWDSRGFGVGDRAELATAFLLT